MEASEPRKMFLKYLTGRGKALIPEQALASEATRSLLEGEAGEKTERKRGEPWFSPLGAERALASEATKPG